jgi:hypothetical protein
MEIIVPHDLALRIHIDAGLTTNRLEGFTKRDGFFYSSHAVEGEDIVELRLNQAIGRLVVRYP